MDLGLLSEHVHRLRRVLGGRVDAMQESLEAHFGHRATWHRPGGGYVFWLRFHASIDTASLLDRAKEGQTGFQPGSLFSSRGGMADHLRLSFAHYAEGEIREGISRLAEVFELRT